jgi:N,N'-diacetyllegionaminate synthase
MEKTYIIAEVGVNHNGDIGIAKELIDVAKKSGANAVKFQAYSTHRLVRDNTPLAKYQSSGNDTSQNQMLAKYEFSIDQFRELKEYCSKVEIDFLLSFFDEHTLSEFNDFDFKTIKIPSGEITNFFLLYELSKLEVDLIMSTGMATDNEIEAALSILRHHNVKRNISLLHCVSEYPVPENEVNLRSISKLKELFSLNVGFSDHSEGIEVASLAVAAGATIIEKHITLNNELEGPDHKASLEPPMFTNMVQKIRAVEKILGKSEVFVSNVEHKNISVVRKSLVANNQIKTGQEFTLANLTAKRPADGINPMDIYKLLGKKAKRDYEPDIKIEECEVEE